MHRDGFTRVKRAGPPSDHKSESELMIYASTGGRAGQVDHADDAHEFAWKDEVVMDRLRMELQTNPPTSSTNTHTFIDMFMDPLNPDFLSGAFFCWQLVCTKAFVASSERVTGYAFVGTGGHHYLVGADLKIQRIDAPGYEEAYSPVARDVGPGFGATYLPWIHNSGSTLLDYTNPSFPSFVATGIYAILINFFWTHP